MLRRCSNCILPESYPGITFNEKGVCNYCLTHKKAKHRGEAELINLVEPYRNNNREYDCIVALSGGRDSSFAAYYAVKVLGLRTLLFTSNNGFMPQQTMKNIKRTQSMLNVDLVVERHDHLRKNVKHVISSWMHKPSPAMIGVLCTGCRTGYVIDLVKTAQDNEIPLIITGGGEPEQRSFAVKLLSIPTNSRRRKLSLMLGFSMELVRNPLYIMSPNCSIMFGKELFYRYHKCIKNLKFISIFKFIQWDEEKLLSTIQNELKWKKPSHSRASWRSDCKIHILKEYLYRETLGFTKNDMILSCMTRENMITREEALKRLEHDNIISQQFLIELFNELGLNFYDLDSALKEFKKRNQFAHY